MDARLASEILHLIQSLTQSNGGSPGESLAFVQRGSQVLYARHPGRAAHEPESAVTRLIQGIYDHDPQFARQILRARIFTTEPSCELNRGMVKVAAKRATYQLTSNPPSSPTQLELVEVQPRFAPPAITQPESLSPSTAHEHVSWMRQATELAGTIPRLGPLYESDRPVAALLVDARGQLLSHAVNCNARNRVLHAEVNLIRGFWQAHRRGLPAGARLYVTLKPCRMCASMIWDCMEDRKDFKVYFHEYDPGPMGQQTVLEVLSAARRIAAREAWELTHPIEQHLPTAGSGV